jgi:hypothetical protein
MNIEIANYFDQLTRGVAFTFFFIRPLPIPEVVRVFL